MTYFTDDSHEGTIEYMNRMTETGWSQKQVIASVLGTVDNIIQLIKMPETTEEYTYANVHNVLTGFKVWINENIADKDIRKRLTEQTNVLLLRVNKETDTKAADLMARLGNFNGEGSENG